MHTFNYILFCEGHPCVYSKAVAPSSLFSITNICQLLMMRSFVLGLGKVICKIPKNTFISYRQESH